MDKGETLKALSKEIKACTRCPLRENASCPVPGFGNPEAKYLLIGESPGRDEDRSGIPFVGQAGKRLNELLELAGIDINDCYLTNVCRCRPPSNRDPKKVEVRACVPFLWREIRAIKPEYIITLGRTPLQLFSPYGVSVMHGTMFTYEMED